MWLNYHHLQYFWTVVHCGGFLRAAEELNVSQSAISHQVQALETQLGHPLILRGPRKALELTPIGALVFDYAEAIFPVGRELVQRVRSGGESSITGEKARLRVGAVGSLSRVFQAKFLKPAFGSSGPEIELSVGDRSLLLERLSHRELDLVIAASPLVAEARPHAGGGGRQGVKKSVGFVEGAISFELDRTPYCIVGPPGAAKLRRSFPRGLESEALYVLQSEAAAGLFLERFAERKRASIQLRGWIGDVALLRLLALEENVLVMIPRIGVEREIEEKKLTLIHEFSELAEVFYAIIGKQRFPHPWTEKLIHDYRTTHPRQ